MTVFVLCTADLSTVGRSCNICSDITLIKSIHRRKPFLWNTQSACLALPCNCCSQTVRSPAPLIRPSLKGGQIWLTWETPSGTCTAWYIDSILFFPAVFLRKELNKWRNSGVSNGASKIDCLRYDALWWYSDKCTSEISAEALTIHPNTTVLFLRSRYPWFPLVAHWYWTVRAKERR